MLYREFIRRFEVAKSSGESAALEAVKARVRQRYIPFENKVAASSNIVENTMWVVTDLGNGNGGKRRTFNMRSALQYEFFVITVIQQYTDIEFQPEETLSLFNKFEELGITSLLFEAIGDDIKSFDTVLKCAINDELENYRSTSGFLEGKIEAIETMLGTLVDLEGMGLGVGAARSVENENENDVDVPNANKNIIKFTE